MVLSQYTLNSQQIGYLRPRKSTVLINNIISSKLHLKHLLNSPYSSTSSALRVHYSPPCDLVLRSESSRARSRLIRVASSVRPNTRPSRHRRTSYFNTYRRYFWTIGRKAGASMVFDAIVLAICYTKVPQSSRSLSRDLEEPVECRSAAPGDDYLDKRNESCCTKWQSSHRNILCVYTSPNLETQT